MPHQRLLMRRQSKAPKFETERTPIAGYLAFTAVIQGEVMLSNLIESLSVCTRRHVARRIFLLALLVISATVGLPRLAHAQSAEPAAAAALDPKAVEERLADLEAYVNNSARVSKESKIAGPGPGHNGWIM